MLFGILDPEIVALASLSINVILMLYILKHFYPNLYYIQDEEERKSQFRKNFDIKYEEKKH